MDTENLGRNMIDKTNLNSSQYSSEGVGVLNTPNKQTHKNLNKPKPKSVDAVENTIFVGNLPNTTTQKELKKLFRSFGVIISTRLRCAVRKELKISKKMAIIKKDFHEDSTSINGFVKFKTFESCKSALKTNGKLFNGHHLRVKLAKDEGKSDPKKSIFIGNLPFKVQDEDLWSAFEDCGTIDSVRVVRDERTGIGKGFGYVNFKSPDAVELALKLDGMTVLDRDIRISRVNSGLKQQSSNHKKVKTKKQSKHINESDKSSKTKPKLKSIEQEKTVLEKKQKLEFQGQKTKPSVHKKMKKKKKFDKKKLIIKQIASGMDKNK